MSQTTPHHTPTLNFYHPAAQEHLLQAAAESGAAVRRGARVTRVQPGTPATVMVEQDGHTEELHARLVVGADGRTSMVRKWADFLSSVIPNACLCLASCLRLCPLPRIPHSSFLTQVLLQSQLYRAVLAASEAVLLPHKTIPTGRAGIPS